MKHLAVVALLAAGYGAAHVTTGVVDAVLLVGLNLLAVAAVPGLILLVNRIETMRQWPRLAADCDRQHAALMAGDDLVGVYGYPPAPLSTPTLWPTGRIEQAD